MKIVLPHLLATGIFFSLPGFADKKQDADNFFELTLEELMKVPVSIASTTPTKYSEAPGIVTLITEQELAASGARDLIDVLRLVPGFSFATDVQGAVGLMVRGNWAHEGKILMMVDGLMVNELLFSTVLFGNHFHIENVKRIEIMRGPGSGIYGGFAELAVINIISKKGGEIDGVTAGLTWGATSDKSDFRKLVHLSAGKKTGDMEYSFYMEAGESHRSDRTYTDIYGNTYDMSENELNPEKISINLQYGNFEFKTLYEDFELTSRDMFGANLLKAYPATLQTFNTKIQYTIDISDKLSLTPMINYKKDRPWKTTAPALPGEIADYFNFHHVIEKKTYGLHSLYQPSNAIHFDIGAEYIEDTAYNKISGETYWNGKDNVHYRSHMLFLQSHIKTDFANISLGSRYEKHDQYGDVFLPRFAVNKKVGKANYKLLYNRAFRAPAMANIDGSFFLHPNQGKPVIEPESADVYDFEINYQLTPNMMLVTNFFKIDIDKTITYVVTNTGSGYENRTKSGSKGFELELKSKFDHGFFNINYSYYSTSDINTVEDFAAPQNSSSFLAAPQHKVSMLASYQLSSGLKINPSFTYLGRRYGYTKYDAVSDDVISKKFSAQILANLNIACDDYLTKGLDVSIGIFNLLDKKQEFIQPYDGWHAPIPGPSRELVMKVSYDF